MKTISSTVLLFCICHASAQVPNSGFENWSNGNPVSWTGMTGGPGYNTVTQFAPGYAGASAAKGTVIDFNGFPIGPVLSSTDVNNNGFAVTQNYAAVNYYYQTNLDPNSSFAAIVNMEDATGTVIGGGTAFTTTNISSWTLSTIPIFYTPGSATECIISFMITNPFGLPVGDYFLVDEVTLSASVGLHENELNGFNIEKISPNPAYDQVSVYYSLAQDNGIELQLADITGRIVKQLRIENEIAGRHKIMLDVSGLNAGNYLLTLSSGQYLLTRKIQVY